MLQGKVWVWGQGGGSAEEDSKLVEPALIAELEDQWPPRGQDGQPWDVVGAEYMRDLPYGEPRAPASALLSPQSLLSSTSWYKSSPDHNFCSVSHLSEMHGVRGVCYFATCSLQVAGAFDWLFV